MTTTALLKLREQGYWRIVIRPTTFNPDVVANLGALEQAVRESIVEVRGWDYPHWPKAGVEREVDAIVANTDWEAHKEFWKAFRSGQFIHYLALREDWLSESSYDKREVAPRTVLEYENAIFGVTEVFLFAARWASRLSLGPKMRVELSLFQLAGRQLHTFDPGRMDFSPIRKASAGRFDHATEYDPQQLIAAPAALALPILVRLFELLDWDTSVEHLETVQSKLLPRR